MDSSPNPSDSPVFEIDQADEYAPYFLSSQREVLFYLNLLVQRRNLLSAHIDQNQFFPTLIVAVDELNQRIFLDPAQDDGWENLIAKCSQLTLVTSVDRVKTQIRTSRPEISTLAGRRALLVSMPKRMLRLQRREFFRLEPPVSQPIYCKVTPTAPDGTLGAFELRVADISGGGVSLIAPTSSAEYFQVESDLENCRLDIPDEQIIQANLRIRKAVEILPEHGQRHLRIGCEFVGLSNARIASVERYIARIERERKARESGLG